MSDRFLPKLSKAPIIQTEDIEDVTEVSVNPLTNKLPTLPSVKNNSFTRSVNRTAKVARNVTPIIKTNFSAWSETQTPSQIKMNVAAQARKELEEQSKITQQAIEDQIKSRREEIAAMYLNKYGEKGGKNKTKKRRRSNKRKRNNKTRRNKRYNK
jgi:hypothetical protein